MTIANGRIYGVTATGVFALDAAMGRHVWYDTHLAARKTSFDMAPQPWVPGGLSVAMSAIMTSAPPSPTALSGTLLVSSVHMGDGGASTRLVPDHGKAWHVWSIKHARPFSFRSAT